MLHSPTGERVVCSQPHAPQSRVTQGRDIAASNAPTSTGASAGRHCGCCYRGSCCRGCWCRNHGHGGGRPAHHDATAANSARPAGRCVPGSRFLCLRHARTSARRTYACHSQHRGAGTRRGGGCAPVAPCTLPCTLPCACRRPPELQQERWQREVRGRGEAQHATQLLPRYVSKLQGGAMCGVHVSASLAAATHDARSHHGHDARSCTSRSTAAYFITQRTLELCLSQRITAIWLWFHQWAVRAGTRSRITAPQQLPATMLRTPAHGNPPALSPNARRSTREQKRVACARSSSQ